MPGRGLQWTLMDYRRGIAYNAKTTEKTWFPRNSCRPGGVAERPIAPVLKTGDAERHSRVRISPPPLISAGKLLGFCVFPVASAPDAVLSPPWLACPRASIGVSESRSESAKRDADRPGAILAASRWLNAIRSCLSCQAPGGTALDGEMIVFKDRKSDFPALQLRGPVRAPLKIRSQG